MFEAFIEDARIILGRVQVEPTTVRLDELVAQVIAQARGTERSSRSSLRVTIDAGEALIDGDSRALQRLIIRLAAVIARRTHEAATIDLVVSNEDRRICVSLTAPTSDADWSESDLLELRISTLMATVFRGTLELLASPGTAALRVLLPQAARAT